MHRKMICLLAILLVIPVHAQAVEQLTTITGFPEQVHGGESIMGNFSFFNSLPIDAMIRFGFHSPYNLTDELLEISNLTILLDGIDIGNETLTLNRKSFDIYNERHITEGTHTLAVIMSLAPNIKPGEYGFQISVFGSEDEEPVVITKKRNYWWFVPNETIVEKNVTVEVEIEVPVPAEPLCGNEICETGENVTCIEDCKTTSEIIYVEPEEPARVPITEMILIVGASIIMVQFGYVRRRGKK